MDNRKLLTKLGVSQQEWGRLVGVSPRTAQLWFREGQTLPKWVNLLLRFFVAYPRAFKLFVGYIKSSK